MPRAAAIATFAWVITSSAAAYAEGASSQAAAQALFDEARALVAQGKYAEACPKFAESQRLDPGAGTLLNLGNCYEKNGQTASAWVTFKDAAAAADVKHRADWSQRARERAAALEPILSRLTIVVPPPARIDGLDVKRDGVEVGTAEWGVAIPVDPGEHVVEVGAPKKKRWTTSATVAPKGGAATITVPALEDDPAAIAAAKPPVASVAPAPATTTAPTADAGATATSDGAAQRTIGLAVAGAGLVGVAVGSIFGVSALSKNDDAKRLCPTTTCTDPAGVQANDDAKSAATVSTIAMVAGGAALVGGAILFFTAPRRASSSGALRVEPIVGPRDAGIRVGGAF